MPPTLPNLAPQLKPELRHIPLTPLQTHELLLALSRPNYSLINIAADFDLTLPQLSLLISSGEFTDEFRACTDANTRFIRHAAAIQLHTVIRTLVATLEEVHYQLHSVPINHLNHHSLEARRFIMEVGRRSAVTLQQLTKLNVPTRITEAPTTIIKARPAQTAPETPNSAPKSTQIRLSTGSMSMGSAFGLPDDSTFDDAFSDSAFVNKVGTIRDPSSPSSSASGASSALSALGGSGVPPERTSSSPANSNQSLAPSPDASSDNLAGTPSAPANLDAADEANPSALNVASKPNANLHTNPAAISLPQLPTPKSLRAAAQAKPAAVSPPKQPRSSISNPPFTPISTAALNPTSILDPALQKQLMEAMAIADAFLADLPPETHPPHS